MPQPTEREMELNELVRRIGEEGVNKVFGSTTDEHKAYVASWSDGYKLDVAFEVGKRELLTPELRIILGMGPAPEPLTDDLSEFENQKGGGDGSDKEEEEETFNGDEEEDVSAEGGTVV